jgi:hypothetical protein
MDKAWRREKERKTFPVPHLGSGKRLKMVVPNSYFYSGDLREHT